MWQKQIIQKMTVFRSSFLQRKRETVVLANVSGKVLSMEVEHGTDSITVKLAVATIKTEIEKEDREETQE